MSAHPAVLFDVDGTLVDSNYLHVYAWQRAFHEAGVPMETWRVHRSIGMDGTTLVHDLLEQAGRDPDEDLVSGLKSAHSEYYQRNGSLLEPLPGARDLLRRVADLGLQVVLATSAPPDELEVLQKVLDCDDVIAAITSADDVDTAKPEPDIVQVALDRVGVTAQQAVFVGDAVWDAEACARVQVPSIAVLSGGFGRDELRIAGAGEVFENPRDLLDHLPDTAIGKLDGQG
ncbi:MAG: HAD family hydrolase [Actinomycetota bacterium]|nr:HAD family hydrolase [Actinomycetota bacterium]